MRIVTASEMKEIERRANESGLSYYEMMENAGRAAFEIICRRYPLAESFLIFCGKGNNGGDGLVAARLASLAGKKASVVLAEGEPVTEDAKKNRLLLPEAVDVLAPGDELPEADIIIDALYGTGFHGSLRQSGVLACGEMNGSGLPIIALDIPSGVKADTGEVSDGAVKAEITIAFDSYKKVHAMGISNCGECILADIGIPEACH